MSASAVVYTSKELTLQINNYYLGTHNQIIFNNSIVQVLSPTLSNRASIWPLLEYFWGHSEWKKIGVGRNLFSDMKTLFRKFKILREGEIPSRLGPELRRISSSALYIKVEWKIR